MYNKLSDHAKTRFRQRGIREQLIDYLEQYGKWVCAPGGARQLFLTRREANKIIGVLKKEIHWLERANGIFLIEKDGIILTGYHRT